MAETVSRVTDVHLKTAPLALSDATSTAEEALDKAATFCARKMQLSGRQAVVDCLQQGDGCACGYFSYALAEEVAECIGDLDESVRAVYVADYDATPQDVCFDDTHHVPLVHLIIWAERRSAALAALVSVLDRALVQGYGELVDASDLKHLLDAQIVDDGEVKGRVGYGALLSSIHNRPVRVWQR
ncbi:MAG: hypothetical protein PVI59_05265 [Anaerolineae bacterium]|jgi:hypothetical protein